MLPKHPVSTKGLLCLILNLPKVSKITNFLDLPKVSKMTYSELESDFSFVINSVSDFDSTFESGSESKSESESDFSSVFMNQDICIFFTLYLHSSK